MQLANLSSHGRCSLVQPIRGLVARIARCHRDANPPFILHKRSHHFVPKCSRENPAMLACNEKNKHVQTWNDAKYLRFGLSPQSGLRCECARRQTPSDSGPAMRTTKIRGASIAATLESAIEGANLRALLGGAAKHHFR